MFKFHQKPDYLFGVIISLKQIFRTPISLLIIFIMTLTLYLVMISHVLWHNNELLGDKWNESAEIALYLKKNNLEEAQTLVARLQAHSLVAKAELIQADYGIKVFTDNVILKNLVDSFKENPLPNVITIYPKIKMLTKNITGEFIEELNNISEVKMVKTDLKWLGYSHNLLTSLSRLSLFFTIILSIYALLIISSISYGYAKITTFKYTDRIILQYQCVWFCLISNLLALVFNQILLIELQNHGVRLEKLAITSMFLIFLSSILLSFFSAKIGANNSKCVS
jgi:cell division protein FtsX